MNALSFPSDIADLRLLFGGAIQAIIPQRFQDVSNIRTVPDNQEVYADPSRDESVIVELLELKPEINDLDCAKWHFEEVSSLNAAGSSARIEDTGLLSEDQLPFFDSEIKKTYAIGTMAVAKGRQGIEALNIIRCYMACIRLKNVSTDILITINEPLHISERSSVAQYVGSGETTSPGVIGIVSARQTFASLLASFKIVDYALFG